MLRVRRLGIDTDSEPVVFLHADSPICRAEGFRARRRIEIHVGAHTVVAILNTVRGDLLSSKEVGLSETAWKMLDARDGDVATFDHPPPLDSFSHVRARLHGKTFTRAALRDVTADIVHGRYTGAHLAAFIAACSGEQLSSDEITALTCAMLDTGERLEWPWPVVADKHSAGGLPGNRTTLIVVLIVAAAGLPVPKTSSRAITSPAGSADTMEMLAPVELDTAAIRRVVEQEGGCIAWGGSANLTPADDHLVRMARLLDLDSVGQMVASIISKKAAAGATHVVIDLPVGPTAKVRSLKQAQELSMLLTDIGARLGLTVEPVMSDGTQPVGRGIGPALEAREVLAVLENRAVAPPDLAHRALQLAGKLLELCGKTPHGNGYALAHALLQSGAALRKFEAICAAQGGRREPPVAPLRHEIRAVRAGSVLEMDNRMLAKIARLAGAPDAPAAGIEMHVRLDDVVTIGQPLFTLHAQSRGELEYAQRYADRHPGPIRIGEDGWH